jgi:HPt (histidine-containing phosphotransfer) domain-containing protein
MSDLERSAALRPAWTNYLPKPLRREQLEDVLGRWLSPERRLATASDPGDPRDAPTAEGEPELEQVDVLTPDMLHELTGTFEQELHRRVCEIEAAVTRRDELELRRVAHLLKGSSATFGAERLRAMCLRLEHSGRSGDAPLGEAQLE